MLQSSIQSMLHHEASLMAQMGKNLPAMQEIQIQSLGWEDPLKEEALIPPASFFFLKTALAIWGLLCFHMNCEIFCSSYVKNAIGNLIGIALNL